jgi:hypothetical protein
MLFTTPCTLLAQWIQLQSPDGHIAVTWIPATAQMPPQYGVSYKGVEVVRPSMLGFDISGQEWGPGFEVVSTTRTDKDQTWTTVWGEERVIRDQYHQMEVNMQHPDGRRMNLIFRVYNDGLGFRYAFPAQPGPDSLYIREERTEFNFTEDHTAWWIPADWDSNEHRYTRSSITGIDTKPYLRDEKSISTMVIPEQYAVQTPITMRTGAGVHLSIHEAALVNFPALMLRLHKDELRFEGMLVPGRFAGHKAAVAKPFSTPWRRFDWF